MSELSLEQKSVNSETWEHIYNVQKIIIKVQQELLNRALTHDQSKLHTPEVEYFTQFTKNIKGVVYGTPEYLEGIKSLGPALVHHYANNTHHPEHFEDGIEGMSLVDVLEMLCDWYASCMRYKDGDIRKSLEINRDRFKISDQLLKIMENTLPILEEK